MHEYGSFSRVWSSSSNEMCASANVVAAREHDLNCEYLKASSMFVDDSASCIPPGDPPHQLPVAVKSAGTG